MTDAMMDFKAALLKSRPISATASVFKPSTGDASTARKKEQDTGPANPLNASGDKGRNPNVKRMRNRSRKRSFDTSIPQSRALFNVNMLPTIIETGPTPPMSSESPSPCVESWTYVTPQGRPALTSLQAMALRARDRLASRIQTEFSPQPKSALALNRLRDQVFSQLQCQLDVVTTPTPAKPIVNGSETPFSSSTNANGLLIQLEDTGAKDKEIAQLKETLEKEKEMHGKTKQDLTAMSGVLVLLRDELDVYQKRMTVLEKEKEEMTLKLEEQEATIQAFGKPWIPLSRSSSASSSCAESDHVLSSSGMSSVSPTSSERELAFSTFSTLALRRKANASPGGTLAPPKTASLAHRRGSSLQHTPTKPGLAPRPLSNASNVVNSGYGYLRFTIPSKVTDAKIIDPPTLTATPVGSLELSDRL